jgi:hypothetical protein
MGSNGSESRLVSSIIASHFRLAPSLLNRPFEVASRRCLRSLIVAKGFHDTTLFLNATAFFWPIVVPARR